MKAEITFDGKGNIAGVHIQADSEALERRALSALYKILRPAVRDWLKGHLN